MVAKPGQWEIHIVIHYGYVKKQTETHHLFAGVGAEKFCARFITK